MSNIMKCENSEEAQQAFDSSLNISDPDKAVTFGRERENVLQAIEDGLGYRIIEDEISDTRASFIWEDNGGIQGMRRFIYKNIYLSSMRGRDFESENEILHAMNTLEDCIKAVIDDF